MEMTDFDYESIQRIVEEVKIKFKLKLFKYLQFQK
jgi:hypothetical protein